MRLRIKIWGVLLALVPCVASAQVKPRVAGLGGNAEYMQLLEREQELTHKEDSLGRVITQLRHEFRTGEGDRREFGNRILQLENEVFEVKNQAGIIAAKISDIEERFIIESLRSGAETPTGGQTGETEKTPSGTQYAMLTANERFRELLPAEDYAALVRAQSLERPAADMLLKYFTNYDGIAAMREEYESTESAAVADSLYARYTVLDGMNVAVADSLADMWSTIFDNKLFAYNYILQTQNQMRLLARMEAAGRETRDEIARQRPNTASEEVVAYLLEKSLVFEYETTLAELFGLTAAADSLDNARKIFELLKRPVPDIAYTERSFIEYADITVHSPAKYTASNPIPEVAVYRSGLVYRIQLGVYTARQAVSVFKGAYPLGYVRQDDGKWAYYAGAYADFAGAEKALEEMKKRGFRNAKIAVWSNGNAVVLEDKPVTGNNGPVTYRVEISGARGGLPEATREAIAAVDDGKDISRAGNLFMVGPFTTSLEAEEMAAAIRKSDPALSAGIVANNP